IMKRSKTEIRKLPSDPSFIGARPPSLSALEGWRTERRQAVRRLSVLSSLLSVLVLSVFVLSEIGCKSPFDRTRDASSGGGLGTFGANGGLVVFSNELKTGGGSFFYPGGENQTISFADTSNPI